VAHSDYKEHTWRTKITKSTRGALKSQKAHLVHTITSHYWCLGASGVPVQCTVQYGVVRYGTVMVWYATVRTYIR
jgi:hypothetical protein